MNQEEVVNLEGMIVDHGVHNFMKGVIQALQNYADESSDMGLKEKAAQAANMADVLREINGD